MKYKHICALLAVQALKFETNMLGNNLGVKFNKEQLEVIENALAENAQEDLKAQVENLIKEKAALEEQLKGKEVEEKSLTDALSVALELNGMEAGATAEESIQVLGAKCKEYGASKNRHIFPKTDGKDKDPSADGDGLIGGVIDPNDDFYQALKNRL